LATIDAFPKVGAALALSVVQAGSPTNHVAWAEVYLCTKWYPEPSNRLATIRQCYRQENGPIA